MFSLTENIIGLKRLLEITYPYARTEMLIKGYLLRALGADQ